MKQVLLYTVFTLMSLSVIAQHKLEKDIDFDGVIDTIFIENDTSTIVCLLSSKNFKRIESKPIEILNIQSGIVDVRNGFYFENN